MALYESPEFQVGQTDDEALTAAYDGFQNAEAEFKRWRDDTEMRSIIGDDDYRSGLMARATARDQAVASYRDLAQARASVIRLTPEDWNLEPDELNLIAKATLARIEVKRGKRGVLDLPSRVRLVPK